MKRRWRSFAVVSLLGISAVWALVSLVSVQASAQPSVLEPPPAAGLSAARLSPVGEDAALLGEPCGCGEQLPPWVLCLHGTVSLEQSPGQGELLDGVPITISLGSKVVTGTTFVHPGYTTPTYGVDVSLLEPGFLQPVTLTAIVSGTTVPRQVVVFPDFGTQSQRYDVRVAAVGALAPTEVWGHVVDFGAGGPVTGAVVVAEYGGASVAVTSTQEISGALPSYALDLAAIGAGPGSVVTLTARYGGDADRQAVTLGDEPLQVDFVTGWKCDGFDPLPRSSGGSVLPRSTGGTVMPRGSGGTVLPDVACFWGYGVVDGEPAEEVAVQLVVSDTVYEAQTRLYSGEEEPRYGIGVWGGHTISGQVALATGVYKGFTASEADAVSLDAELSQRMDLAIMAQPGVLGSFTNLNDVQALAWHEGYLWIGAAGGVARLDPSDGSYVQFTTADGLVNYEVTAVAVSPDGSPWFGTYRGVSHYIPASDTWETFTRADGLADYTVKAAAVAPDGSLWFGTGGGVSHYVPISDTWETLTSDDGLASDRVLGITVAPDGSFWFGTLTGGVSHYIPISDTWETFTTAHGLVDNIVNAIAVAPDGSPWFGTGGGGVSHYVPISDTWETYTTAHGLTGDMVYAIAAGPDGSLWFGTASGVSHYTPISDTWETFTTAHGLARDWVYAIAVSPDGSLWFGTFDGVSHYTPISDTWETFTDAGGLANRFTSAIAVGLDDSLWFGTASGVNHYTPISDTWETFTTAHGLADTTHAIAVDPDGSLWFGTCSGVSHYIPISDIWETFTTAHGLADKEIYAIAVDPDGSLWFGTWQGGVSHYTPISDTWETFTTSRGLADNEIRAIAVDPDGSLWFGTHGGVNHYVPISDTWETFTTAHGLAHNEVRAIAVDLDGSLWFGTYGGGVSHYTPAGDTWETFTTSHGLAGNWVDAIAVSPDGSLQFCTNNGVSHYTPASDTWERFVTADWLVEGPARAIAVAPDGSLWFSNDAGVIHWETAVPASDLSLQMSGPAAALPGQSITYTLHLANHGQAAATNTRLTLTLPVSVTYAGASQPPSSTNPPAWNLSTLPTAGASTLVVSAALGTDLPPGSTAVATATVSTTALESFLSNNTARVATIVRDPCRADARVSLAGPPVLIPGGEALYAIWIDNFGGLDAQTSTLTITLPAELAYQAVDRPPSSFSPLVWDLGTLPAFGSPTHIALTVTVAGSVPAGSDLAVTGFITTPTPDGNPLNNTAAITISTSLTDSLTLILVAPGRLAARYGASDILPRLHALADHPRVRGVVLDVMGDAGVRAAYVAWDADPGNWQKANAVAEAIKALIDQYTIAYANLRYLVIAGGDEIVPFYRVEDSSPTMWRESRYGYQVPGGTIRAALGADMLLTDDFYADHAPTLPASPFWTDGRPLYLPDFAIGRLVETPEEIAAIIDGFLANDGTISLDPGLVGTLGYMTDDLGQAQCAVLSGDGLAVTCTQSMVTLRQEFLNQPSGSAWIAVHGNHFSVGELYTTDILNRTQSFSRTLAVSIGCHTGLNVPASSGTQPDHDLAQAMTGRGGTMVAPTAYAYASSIGIGYSEELALALTRQLVMTQTQETGPALVRAKQAYYAEHSWFDPLDEKVLLPVTLYGLPMLQVTTPDSLDVATDRVAAAPHRVRDATSVGATSINGTTTVTHTFSGLAFAPHTTTDGVYYDYGGQTIAQDGLPVQPAFSVPLTATTAGRTARGVFLRSATYTEHLSFNPVIAQAWAVGAERSAAVEPPVTLTGWDRELPYALVRFEGLERSAAMLDVVPGAYDGDRQAELLFGELVLEVVYGDGADDQAPVILSARGLAIGTKTSFRVDAADDVGIDRIVVVADDGQAHWQSVALVPSGDTTWEGQMAGRVVRFYVQAADAAGNVTAGAWTEPRDMDMLYLPIVLRNV